MGPCHGRAACRSALVSTCGVTIGVWPSSSKKGDGADLPVSLPFAMNGITDAMAFRLNLSAVPAGEVEAARARIDGCDDVVVLNGWLRRAVTATQLDEVFGASGKTQWSELGVPMPTGLEAITPVGLEDGAGTLDKFRELNVTLATLPQTGWGGVWEYVSAVDAAGNPQAWKPLTLINFVAASIGNTFVPVGLDKVTGIMTAGFQKDATVTRRFARLHPKRRLGMLHEIATAVGLACFGHTHLHHVIAHRCLTEVTIKRHDAIDLSA